LLTFSGEQVFLGGGLVVDAVKGERELFSLVLGARDLDEGQRFPVANAVCVHDDILVQLLFKQRTDSGNHTHRHSGSIGTDTGEACVRGKQGIRSVEKMPIGCPMLGCGEESRGKKGGKLILAHAK
jgi:hypothetical protein